MSNLHTGGGVLVNDIHSRLNRTRVREIIRPESTAALQAAIVRAGRAGQSISVSGGRHAMGGQQFGTDTLLLDMRGLDAAGPVNAEVGTIEVGAGIQWPALIDHLERSQAAQAAAGARTWAIAQKQTGANALTLGGAISANVHGRGLCMAPFISDVDSFTLVNALGERHVCDRTQNAELFRLAAGGYGLFGVIDSLVLRLTPRRKLERVVSVLPLDELLPSMKSRIAEGFLYGDFQYVTDETSPDFLRRGVFSCYRPIDDAAPFTPSHKHLTSEDWRRLAGLAHTDKARAFEVYAAHYLSTSGQIYWSDRHQEAVYDDDYHRGLGGSAALSSEVIAELYVPRPHLVDFLDTVREDFRRHSVNLIYGTIRLIQPDTDSFLAWAKAPYACVIFNLHTEHTLEGIAHTADAFRRLIDCAAERGGSYYLAYGRDATRAQVERCYPQFAEFLRLKRVYDPEERFVSDWYRHYCQLFGVTQ